MNAYSWITFENKVESFVNYSLNLILNGADIIEELTKLDDYIKEKDYNNVGTYIGKIVADITLKNPLRNSWSFRNSEIIPFRLTNENAHIE